MTEYLTARKDSWTDLLPQRAQDTINQSPLFNALRRMYNAPPADLRLPAMRDGPGNTSIDRIAEGRSTLAKEYPQPWHPAAEEAVNTTGFLANFIGPGARLPGRPQIARAPEGLGGGYDRLLAPRVESEQWDSLTKAITKNGRRIGDFEVVADPRFDRVAYDLVPTGKPVWNGDGTSNSVGQFQAKPGQNGGVEVTNARVAEHLRRQGLGSSVYDIIARDFPQTKLVPSPWNQLSDNAVAFWAKRDRNALLKTRELARTGYERDLYPNRDIPAYAEKSQGIRAYHGSPHDFDKFDIRKMGTGEGAQAYGPGLYFAEAEGVARGYKAALSNRTIDGRPIDYANPAHLAADYVDSYGAMAASEMRKDISRPGVAAALKFLERGEVPKIDGGRMYEVRINADPETFLDWDKPLSQQSENVRALLQHPAVKRQAEFFNDTAGEKLTGKSAYGAVSGWNTAGNQRVGSGDTSALREAGIPGVKYLDQGSRAAGQGSRNYVVFDDKLIEILRKYGLLPPIAAGAAASQSQEPPL